jgi:hypothetical protein
LIKRQIIKIKIICSAGFVILFDKIQNKNVILREIRIINSNGREIFLMFSVSGFLSKKQKIIRDNKRIIYDIRSIAKCPKMSLKVPRKKPLSGICNAAYEQEKNCNCKIIK